MMQQLYEIPPKKVGCAKQRGREKKGKRILSFSLFGKHPKYLYGAIRNLQQQPTVYPGWLCRFYVAEDVASSAIDELSDGGAEVIIMRPEPKLKGMLWRYLAVDESNLDACLMLDADSPLLERQKCATDEWLNSDKFYHVIRDHYCHQVKIMGGLFGVKGGAPVVLNMRKEIEDWISRRRFLLWRNDNDPRYDEYGIDQRFLAQVVYPRIKKHTLFHVDPGFTVYPGEEDVRPIPGPKRSEHHYIGIAINRGGAIDPSAPSIISLKRFQFIHALRYLLRSLSFLSKKLRNIF